MLSNFAATKDRLDLRGVAFAAGASASAASDVLTLSDGGKAYHFKLAGAVGSSFTVGGDGHGGTLIEIAVAGMAQAAAAFAPQAGAGTTSSAHGSRWAPPWLTPQPRRPRLSRQFSFSAAASEPK